MCVGSLVYLECRFCNAVVLFSFFVSRLLFVVFCLVAYLLHHDLMSVY